MCAFCIFILEYLLLTANIKIFNLTITMPTYNTSSTSSSVSGYNGYSVTQQPSASTTYNVSSSNSSNASTTQSSSNKKSEYDFWRNTGNTLSSIASTFQTAIRLLGTIDLRIDILKVQAEIEKALREVALLTQQVSLAVNAAANGYVSAINAALTSFTQGINEGAYAAASSALDIAATNAIIEKQMEIGRQKLTIENQVTDYKRDAGISNIKSEAKSAKYTVIAEIMKGVSHMFDGWEIAGFGVGNAISGIVTMMSEFALAQQSVNAERVKLENEMMVTNQEAVAQIKIAALDAQLEIEKAWIEAGKEVAKAWLQYTEYIEGELLKFEASANDMGVGMGLYSHDVGNASEKTKRQEGLLADYKRTLLETQEAIAKWGKTMEDAQKLQNAYQGETGRNIMYNNRDFESSFALDLLAGEDGLSEKIASTTQIFNKSVSTTNDMVFEMFQNVNKMGLNGRKYMQELVKNLKLANKYQFKGGVKNLMEMAAWAQKTRFNMDSLDGMLDKVHEGGLEGVITQAAQLQVLGGTAAMGADPLAMAWEAYNDPAAYAKRMTNMTHDMGTFDKTTGETYFNMADQMRIEAMAKAQGRSKEDLMNQIRERNKRDQIDKIVGNQYNDEQLTNISSKAQWVDGQWKVNVWGENGKLESKSVDELTASDLEKLVPVETEERIEDHVAAIRDMMTRLTAGKLETSAQMSKEVYDKWWSNEETRIYTVTEDFKNQFSDYKAKVETFIDHITNSQKSVLSLVPNNGNGRLDTAVDDIIEAAGTFSDALKNLSAQANSLAGEISGKQNFYHGMVGNSVPDPNREDPMTKFDTKAMWSGIFSEMGSFFKQGASLFWEALTAFTEPILELLGKLMKELWQWLSPLLNNIGSFFSGLWDSISIFDGVAQSDGNSSLIGASNIIPIHDGATQFAKTDPQDTAIFAKVGGPFDTLFKGVFGEITHANNLMTKMWSLLEESDGFYNNGSNFQRLLYNSLNNFKPNGAVNSLSNTYNNRSSIINFNEGDINRIIEQVNTEIQNFINYQKDTVSAIIREGSTRISRPYTDFFNVKKFNNVMPSKPETSPQVFEGNTSQMNRETSLSQSHNNVGKLELSPLKIELSGRIEVGGNGQYTDMMKQLQDNPLFMRQLTQMISETISRNLSGGKVINKGGQLVGGLGLSSH